MAKMTRSQLRGSLVTYKMSEGVSKQARQLSAAYRKVGGQGGVVRQAGQECIQWMQRQAIVNLDRKIRANRRPTHSSTSLLKQTILNPDAHTVSNTGFRFMVRQKVYTIMGDDRFYAFSLEYGDRSQVGKYRYFEFLGRQIPRGGGPLSRQAFNQRRDPASRHRTAYGRSAERSNHPLFGVQRQVQRPHLVTDRIVGPRERRTVPGASVGRELLVRINRPVPEYRYGRDAAAQLVRENIFLRYAQRIVDSKSGMKGVVLIPGTNVPLRKGASLLPAQRRGTVTGLPGRR